MSTTKYPAHATVAALFSVAPERVFDAFLDTKLIGQLMFGPGVELDHAGRYVEIERPRHLVFTWAVHPDEPGDGSLVVIDIAPIIDGCELTLTHQLPAEHKDLIGKSKEAWGRMLDKLTEVL